MTDTTSSPLPIDRIARLYRAFFKELGMSEEEIDVRSDSARLSFSNAHREFEDTVLDVLQDSLASEDDMEISDHGYSPNGGEDDDNGGTQERSITLPGYTITEHLSMGSYCDENWDANLVIEITPDEPLKQTATPSRAHSPKSRKSPAAR